MNTSGHYLEFCQIGQTFPGVKALQDISFGCSEGSVHALMGENGAGKSTLLRILSGNYVPTTGEMHINGKPVHFQSAADALNSGIAIIYQELHLVPEITVAENIYLGQLPQKFGVVDRKRLRQMAKEQLEHLGVDIDPDTPLKHLSIGQWQMVEIAKALTRKAKIIAFDEPTSSLSAREITQLFRVIRELKAEGRIILYVSHRMEEILDLCDCVTVFKDGRYVTTFPDTKEITHEQLIRAMVGRDVGDLYGYSERKHGAVRLKLNKLVGRGIRHPVSLDVHQGEIVGLFGLVGAGRTEFWWREPTTWRNPCGWPDATDPSSNRCHQKRHHALPGRQKSGRHHPWPFGTGQYQYQRSTQIPAGGADQSWLGTQKRRQNDQAAGYQNTFSGPADHETVWRQSAESHSGTLVVRGGRHEGHSAG
jgi:L-arabinose transport system ATP-binding protein